jgi:hypothetical protein
MLTPTGNLQDWIDNQNRQLRSESDIKIEVFSHSQSTCTLETTLTKKNLQNFNISESGSVLGFETPSVNISFTMFKDGVNENLISIGSFIRISYGYLINGSWSWVEKGVYEISVAKVQNNGLTAQYQAKFLRYQALEQEWDKGGAGTTFTSWLNLLYEELKKFDPYLYVPSPVGTSVFLGYGSFGSKSILGMATALHQVRKGTLVVHQELSSSRYSTAFVEKNIKPTDAPDDTYIISYSNQFKKYEIVDEDYWDDVSIWEYWAIYDESSLIKLKHSIIIKAYLVKNSNMDTQYEGYYPYNFASLSVQPVPETYSGSLGSGDAYVFGNKIILKYPNSTLDDDLDVRITYPYVKMSKQLSVGSGNSLLELDNPFVATAESSDRVSVINHTWLDLIRAFFNEWKDYQVHNELNVRFDPRLEIFDNIVYADTKETLRCGIVESIEMSYAGGFKAKVIIRDIGNYNEPLTLKFLESTTFYITRDNTTNQDFSISVNGGAWRTYTAKQSNYETINVNSGDEIRIKGNLTTVYHSLVHCGRCRLSGNVMSLLGNATEITMPNAFNGFLNNAIVVGIDTPYFLNATILKSNCYSNLFKSTFEEETKFIVPAKTIETQMFYGCFDSNRQKVVLDLTKATSFDTNCLNSLGYDTDIYYGNEITSIAGGYITCSTGGIVNYYFTKYNRDDVPQFDVEYAIILNTHKSSTTNNVYTDNYLLASACVIQASYLTAVNLYHSDKSPWNVLESPTVSFNSDGSATFSEVANAERYELVERNNARINVLGVVSTSFNPKDLPLSDNKEYTAYLRAINDSDKSIISSKLSQQVNFWRVDSTKSYWRGQFVYPQISLSGNVLTITPNGSESKYVIYISGGTPVWFETTETTIDLSTIPNVSAGKHTVYVRYYWDTTETYNYGTVSPATSTSWTKS